MCVGGEELFLREEAFGEAFSFYFCMFKNGVSWMSFVESIKILTTKTRNIPLQNW